MQFTSGAAGGDQSATADATTLAERTVSTSPTAQYTDYLRGVAIIVVLINHFFNDFITRGHLGYANGVIAVFFFLGGYGIYHSVVRVSAEGMTLRAASRFMLRRMLRIYPQYWIALLIGTLAYGQSYTLWDALAVTPRAPWLYWFVSYMMHGYLLAPLLFVLLTRWGLFRYALVMFLSAIIFMLASMATKTIVLEYRYFPIGHILLFAAGFALPEAKKRFASVRIGSALTTVSLCMALAGVYYTREFHMLFFRSALAAYPVLLVGLSVFVFSTIHHKGTLPLSRVVGFFGAHSYPIYLFHLYLYFLLRDLGWMDGGLWADWGVFALVMPVFLVACVLLESGANWFSLRLGRMLLPVGR